MTEKERVVIIGAGYAGLSAACGLAQEGYKVTVLEKNDQLGGRATKWAKDGYVFDLGPSWYWMPEVFDQFFERFGKKRSDYYKIERLDPPYKLFLKNNLDIDVPDKMKDLEDFFEKREKGSSKHLKSFMQQAEYKYRIGMSDYVWRPSISITEFLDPRLAIEAIRLQMFKSQRQHVKQHFKDDVLIQLMEWPVLFLGGSPDGVPALYSMMNHASITLGTWYPEGGMSTPALAMAKLAKELGVEFKTNVNVTKIRVDDKTKLAQGVETEKNGFIQADIVVAAADYHHVEQRMLDPEYRKYDERYWDSRVLSPGSLLFYLGVKKRLRNLRHHNLFFDEDLDKHSEEIYDKPAWPSKPLFYVCVTSISDDKVAPEGKENVFILIPLAPGLEDTDEMREKYYNIVMDRLEQRTGQEIRNHIELKRSWAHKDFESVYNSYKGNAYGLANTLLQTAIFKPSLKPNIVKNLYYSGQLTSPGPGVPPSIISGLVVSKLVSKDKTLRRDIKSGKSQSDFTIFLALFFILVSIFFALKQKNLLF